MNAIYMYIQPAFSSYVKPRAKNRFYRSIHRIVINFYASPRYNSRDISMFFVFAKRTYFVTQRMRKKRFISNIMDVILKNYISD